MAKAHAARAEAQGTGVGCPVPVAPSSPALLLDAQAPLSTTAALSSHIAGGHASGAACTACSTNLTGNAWPGAGGTSPGRGHRLREAMAKAEARRAGDSQKTAGFAHCLAP